MYALDFEYDGKYLSSFGFIICDFNFSDGVNDTTAGSTITFNKVPRNHGKIYSLSSTQYDECITTTFDICKDPDIYDLEDMEISEIEYRDIMRWLNQREFCKFSVITDIDSEHELCYFQASFNIEKLKISEKLYGLRLTMETDKPFGYGHEQIINLKFTSGNTSKTYTDNSDEIGSVYPVVVIKCNQSGNLTIRNELLNCTTIIQNCKSGEVITLHGDTQIITTSLQSHDICNDFNYDFFRIGNTKDSRSNLITSSLACDMTIKHSPIIKDSP